MTGFNISSSPKDCSSGACMILKKSRLTKQTLKISKPKQKIITSKPKNTDSKTKS